MPQECKGLSAPYSHNAKLWSIAAPDADGAPTTCREVPLRKTTMLYSKTPQSDLDK